MAHKDAPILVSVKKIKSTNRSGIPSPPSALRDYGRGIHAGNSMKTAYHFNPQTRVFTGTSEVSLVAGYKAYILPQFATWTELPGHDSNTEQCKYEPSTQGWIVKKQFVPVTAYHKQTREPKGFDDESLATDDYTLEKPQTQWDEWIDGAWVTNKSSQYIAEYNLVDETRRTKYSRMVDPLIAEAAVKRLQGQDVEAGELEQQALAARGKVQAETPWPEPRQS